MREAPMDLLRKATASILPPVSDRTTPVDPTSAAVASSTAFKTNPAPAMPETSASFDSNSNSIDDFPTVDKGPRETPVSPAHGLNSTTIMKGVTTPATKSLSGQTPAPFFPPPTPQQEARTTGLATSGLTDESTPGMIAPSAPGMAPPPAPTSVATPAPLVQAPFAPPPVVVQNAAPPSALKGLGIGIGIALAIIIAVTCLYLFVLKH